VLGSEPRLHVLYSPNPVFISKGWSHSLSTMRAWLRTWNPYSLFPKPSFHQ
jgi:hypothetical protein